MFTVDVKQQCNNKNNKQFFRYFVHKVVLKFLVELLPFFGHRHDACVRKRGVTQPKIYRISSKFSQFIYTLVCNYMPNITILPKAVLQIFCSQGCSYTNAYVRKRGMTQRKIYGIASKVNHFIYILVCNYMPNIRILALAFFFRYSVHKVVHT